MRDPMPANEGNLPEAAGGCALKQTMPGLRGDLWPAGTPGATPFVIPEELLTYTRSILRNEVPVPPKVHSAQWFGLLAALRPHLILPLFYWQISSSPRQSHPPQPTIEELRKEFLASRVSCLRMERQLQEVLDAFGNEGIRALVLRGPALAWSVYPDPALRPSGDLDLLVLPEQMVKARVTLERLGYKCMGKRFEVTRDFFREEEFLHQKDPRHNLPIDLHWNHWELHAFLMAGRDVRVEDLFQRSRAVETSTLTFETLHPVDALIHSAIHQAIIHRREVRLIWLCDVALLCRGLRRADEWRELQERSVEWHARLAVEMCLNLAQVWLGHRLPGDFQDFSRWPQPSMEERAVWYDGRGSHWARLLMQRWVSTPSGLLERVHSLFRLLFPHPDMVRLCYPHSPKWLLPVAYIRRWHRWLKELFLNQTVSSSPDVS